jgi:hypothetical protein
MKRLLPLVLLVACQQPLGNDVVRAIEFSNRSTDLARVTFAPTYDTGLPGLTSTCAVLDAATTVVGVALPSSVRSVPVTGGTYWQLRIYTDSLVLVPLTSFPC